jgi:hypothetical protein
MTNYQKTKIYKIESHLGDKIYVGSTAKEYLSQRFQQHKNDYKKWKETKLKKITSFDIFEEYGVENCNIVLIEEYPCTSKDSKNAREGHYIKTLNCVNKRIEGRTREQYIIDNKESIQQYYQKNKERIQEYSKEYRENNKEQIKEKKKEIITCECGCKFQLTSKERHERSERHIKKIEEQNKPK